MSHHKFKNSVNQKQHLGSTISICNVSEPTELPCCYKQPGFYLELFFLLLSPLVKIVSLNIFAGERIVLKI